MRQADSQAVEAYKLRDAAEDDEHGHSQVHHATA
jgi:hypothetical protein